VRLKWRPEAYAVLLLLVAASGCGLTVREAFDEYGLKRAAFELQCPKEQLELTALNGSFRSRAVAGRQVGVRGCGKQAVYVLSAGAGWVANTASFAGAPGQ
jgi:hypothetical protein